MLFFIFFGNDHRRAVFQCLTDGPVAAGDDVFAFSNAFNNFNVRFALNPGLDLLGDGFAFFNNKHNRNKSVFVRHKFFFFGAVRGDCFSAYWGTRAGKEWVQFSDAEPMIGIMIEHVSAMQHLDEILAVEGLDYVYWGAADYSMSIGLGGPQRYNREVLKAL